MANTPKQAKVITAQDILKKIDLELEQYEEALSTVLLAIDSGENIQYSRAYQRKKAEYEGAIGSLVDLKNFINGAEES